MLKRILDFFWRPCPSGLPHRVRWGTVKNWLGHEYCWHRDCMRKNFAECEVNGCGHPRFKCRWPGCACGSSPEPVVGPITQSELK